MININKKDYELMYGNYFVSYETLINYLVYYLN